MGNILMKLMFLLTLIYHGCYADTDAVNYVHRLLGDNPNDCGPIVAKYFKYVVSVMDAYKFNWNDPEQFGRRHVCTGVIIGSRHILTAENCVHGSSNQVAIVAGSPVRTRNETTTQIVNIDKFLGRGTMGYVIAELHDELKFDFVSAQAITIFPKEKSLQPGQTCHLLGWDRVGKDCEFAKAIHNVNLTVQKASLCEKELFKITKTFCAVDVSEQHLQGSSCLPASGRPLICDDQLAGVEVLTLSCKRERRATYFYDARFLDFTQDPSIIRDNDLDRTSGQKNMANISCLKVVVVVPFFCRVLLNGIRNAYMHN